MTKEDIKKALEICADDCYSCDDCPYDDVINCGNTLKNDVYELIIKQEREIERLKAEVKQAQIDVLNKLKHIYGYYSCYSLGNDVRSLNVIIDELIKEVQNGK